jgi:putative acetyltransferase
MIEIRHERPEDFESVYGVNERAFETAAEADLVERLRAVNPQISLVAVDDDKVVGHIFFSSVSLAPENDKFNAMGLAPMAVSPEMQNSGIGSKLVRRGLEECAKLGFDAVFVLGHAEYYPRFGFTTAKTKGFGCEYDVPDEVFMVIELKPDSLDGQSGTVRYRPEFAGV